MDETQVTLRTSDFDYPLPPELIAQTPPPVRGGSRLLVVGREDAKTRVGREDAKTRGGGEDAKTRRREVLSIPPSGRIDRLELATIQDQQFSDLLDIIPAGDVLVLNSTKVRHARLLGRRASGAPVEVLVLHPGADDTWIAMGKPGSALRPGKRVDLGDNMAVEVLEVLDEGYRRIRFHGASAEDAMRRVGKLPLPPYIDREPTPADDDRYQTVYAEQEGSVAAPTAGLHFTPELLAAVERKGVVIARIDLEVGPGTFKPVDTEDVADHPMHPERYDIPEAAARAIAEARARGAAVWAVGTTVVRALESSAHPNGTIRPGPAETRLMITPGYALKVVDHLITNFHLPRSTLLLLVAAFLPEWRSAYELAIRLGYRFYSYGDAMVIV